MQILRAADRTSTPWKNGGGVTREVAIWPAGAALDAFDWRVSIADVAQAGPFSSFAGVDRVLTVIDGAGLGLMVEGMAPTELDAASAPYPFAGDAACDATLAAGPIRDCNVMVRRGACSARVHRLAIAGQSELSCESATMLVLALDPLLSDQGPLTQEDAVLVARGGHLRLTAEAARVLVVEFESAAGAPALI